MEVSRLVWSQQDIEQRLGFSGGKFTRVNTWLTALIGIALTILVYGVLLLFRDSHLAGMFIERGMYVPYFIVFLTAWSLAVLFVKWRKLAFQKRALQYAVVPQQTDFVLSSTTVEDVMDNIYATVDDPKNFILFNRIVIALSNLKNLGRVTDVGDILGSQAEHDESAMETSYSLVRGFVWAIPVLGFIGTVLGLSVAIGGFGSVLESADDISQIKVALQGVTGGLSSAFETTLQGLIAALLIQMALTFLKKSEEEFLDNCKEYCAKEVVNKLRIMPYEQLAED